MSDKLRQKLRKILLKTPINFLKTSKKVPVKMFSFGKFSSLLRKLSCSEERCMRKASRSAAKSSSNFASFSNSSCSNVSSSTSNVQALIPESLPLSTSFTQNYGQVLDYLRTQFEDSSNSEIFEMNFSTISEENIQPFEVLRSSSPEEIRKRSPSPAREGQRLHTPTANEQHASSQTHYCSSSRKTSVPHSSSADDLEVLRSSPSRLSRQLSPGTPTRSKSKGHTPRKDTPKKSRDQRLQCRNLGCRVWFTAPSSRNRHEAQSCSMLPGTDDRSEKEYLIPTHADLNLDPLCCRSPGCLKKFSNERNRRRHEQVQHKMIDKRGRTVSPTPVSFPQQPTADCSVRPQSCPPPPLFSTFLTPERPSKKRRTSSASSLFDSPTSPLPSPTATLTPTSSEFSSSDTESEGSGTSMNLFCQTCLTQFKDCKYLKRHRCNFRYDPLFCRQKYLQPVLLICPLNVEETLDLLTPLCQEDQVRLCQLQGWCLRSVYPFCFPYKQRSGRKGTIPLISSLTASDKSIELLKKMLKKDGEVNLPKNIILKDKKNGMTAFLSSDILIPPSEYFSVRETAQEYIVSKALDEANDDTSETSDAGSDSECDESDASDVMYSCFAPPPSPHSVSSQDSPDDELPSPPYTANSAFRDYVPLDQTRSPPTSRTRDGVTGAGDGNSEDEDNVNDEGDTDPEDWRSGNLGEQGRNGGGDDNNGNIGCGGDPGDGEDDDDGEDEADDNSGEDDSDGQENPDPHQEFADILPPGLLAGTDGLGSRNLQQWQAASYFWKPWLFPDSAIQSLVRHTKRQFFQIVRTCVGAKQRSEGLNTFAECFLLLLKCCHQLSYEVITLLFALPSKSTASEVFYRQLVHQFRTNNNIPSVIINGVRNMEEIQKLLQGAYDRTPQFFKTLLEDFEDPAGLDRIPVGINVDATYFDIQGSDDIEFQKHLYYQPRSCHTVKFLNFTDLSSKIVGLLPVASSQSPSSGDGLLISKHIELEDTSDTGKYVRTILRGNDRFFVVLITDAGFVVRVPNAPVQARGPTLADVCEEEGAVLLHTSGKYEKYHLE